MSTFPPRKKEQARYRGSLPSQGKQAESGESVDDTIPHENNYSVAIIIIVRCLDGTMALGK